MDGISVSNQTFRVNIEMKFECKLNETGFILNGREVFVYS